MNKLHDLAQSSAGDVAHAVAALCAELRVGSFDCEASLLKSYPTAAVDASRAEIALGGGYCVVLRVNYQSGHMLVESAGPRVQRENGGKSR